MLLKWNEQGPGDQAAFDHFAALYEHERPGHVPLPAAVWDERADEWERMYRQRSDGFGPVSDDADRGDRVPDTVAYLRQRGALTAGGAVADVGCGPGRFAAGFAAVCGRVLGIDLSPRMTAHAERYADSLGLRNVRFMACDFRELDIEAARLSKAFDLVVASITPAVSRLSDLERLMRMSRRWCFCTHIVGGYHELESRMAVELFGQAARRGWQPHRAYALFNLLFLSGYWPEVRYDSRVKTNREPVSHENARWHARCLPAELQTPDQIDRIQRWLSDQADADGTVRITSRYTYAWILWDVQKDMRDRMVWNRRNSSLNSRIEHGT